MLQGIKQQQAELWCKQEREGEKKGKESISERAGEQERRRQSEHRSESESESEGRRCVHAINQALIIKLVMCISNR